MNERRSLPVGMRRHILVGATITEAAALGLTREDLADVARSLAQIAEHDVASLVLPGPAPCGPGSVFEQGGGQWFCGTCQRSFWGSTGTTAEAQAKGHG